MNLSIAEIRPARPDEWDTVWSGCPYATYYHSREWAEIWKNHSRLKLILMPEIIVFSDGSTALLPLAAFSRCKGIVKDYISSYAVTFGGWITNDKIDLDHARLLRRYFTNKIRSSPTDRLVWRINPFDRLAQKSYSAISSHDTTFAIDLTLDFETILKNSSKSHRYNYRKAAKSGVSVKAATTLDEWREYYFQVYRPATVKWGEDCRGIVEWEAFRHMFELSSPGIALWIACYEGKVIAGGLRFYSGKIVVGWLAASKVEYLKLNPHTILNYEIIKDSCGKGYHWFDLGPSPNLKSVYDFKRRFGGEELNCPLIAITSGLKLKILARDLLRLINIEVGGPGLSVCD